MRETEIESNHISATAATTVDGLDPPALASPPQTETPPITVGKRSLGNIKLSNGLERGVSEPVDAGALSQALRGVDKAGSLTQRTLGGSPSRKRQRIWGDRLVTSFYVESDWNEALNLEFF